MRKFYSLVLATFAIVISGFSQDTIDLVSPANLQADYENNVVQLLWEAPVDTTVIPYTIPPGLIGYNIYEGTELIGFAVHPVVSFTDTEPDSAVAYYRITAQYDLAFYGFPGDTAESVPSDKAFVITGISYVLPFSEEFYTGIFETNQWTTESDNWQIAGQTGDPAPSAAFNFSPPVSNYSSSLISTWLGEGSYIDGTIYVKFSLKKQIVSPTVTENLYLDVFDGFEWSQLTVFTNDINTDWVSYKIQLPDEIFDGPFRIRFRVDGENSMNIVNWLIDNILVYRECKAPYDVHAFYPDPLHHGCRVLVEWENPLTPPSISEWLRWDSGGNYDAIGLTGGGTFFVAIRFTPEQLYSYINTALTKIGLFPYMAGGDITLKVWTGPNATNLVRSQPVNYTAGYWNEFILEEPLLITGLEELWLGYQVTTNSGTSVAGIDAGPAVEGLGDLISMDGSVWESMSNSYGLDFNWNLAGYVTNTTTIDKLKSNNALVSYNVFRDDVLIGSATTTEYWDDIQDIPGMVGYKVTAVYSDCESGYSNVSYPWNCHVNGVSDNEIPAIEIYPNPATTNITIDLTGDISELCITEITGRSVRRYSIAHGNTNFLVDVNELPDGIYLVRFITVEGESGGRKLIVKK